MRRRKAPANPLRGFTDRRDRRMIDRAEVYFNSDAYWDAQMAIYSGFSPECSEVEQGRRDREDFYRNRDYAQYGGIG